MKNVIAGLLKKANGKYASIETVNGTPVQIVELGTFKPSAGDFFNSCATIFSTCNDVWEKLSDLATANIVANTETGIYTITINPNTDPNQEASFVEPDTDGDPVMSGNFDVEEIVEPFTAIAQLIVKPHFKKDGTFDKITSATVVVNIANILPPTFKAKPIVASI